jgi:hypothetical protein
MIRGPITATQIPTLSVTESFLDPPARLCGNMWMTRGGIDPRLGPWSLDHRRPIPLPPCPISECPDPETRKVVGWISTENAEGQPFVTIAGNNVDALSSKFEVQTLASDKIRDLAVTSPYLGLLGDQLKVNAQFVGPAVDIGLAGHSGNKIERFRELARITFPLKEIEGKAYRIVHLIESAGVRGWMEEKAAHYESETGGLVINTQETGVYALVHLAPITGQ